MDESRPVEAGACHKVLIMTFSLKTNSTYRQNNHYQRHRWYTEGSCAPPRLFFSSIFNSLPQFYKTPVKHSTKFMWHAIPIRALFAKKWHMVTAIVLP